MTVRPPPDKNPFEEPDDIDATVMQPMAFRRPAAPDPGAAPSPAPAQPGVAPAAFGQGSYTQAAFAQPAFPQTAFASPPAPPAYAPVAMGTAYRPLDDTTLTALTAVSDNPLINAAAPILSMVVRVRELAQHRDVESLRERVIAEMQRFETAAVQAKLPNAQIRNAGYALCATVDDVVMNTAWGNQSLWAHKSLVSTIQKETWGGERFFELLDQMADQPARHLMELELFYLCLSLGFEGKYRVLPRGHSELGRLRDRLYRLIRKERGDADRDLSGNWRGVADGFRPLAAVVPLWLPAGIIAVLVVMLFTWFAYALGEQSDAAYRRLATLLPDKPVEIARVTAPATLPAAPPSRTVQQRVSGFLAAEIKAGLIEVGGDAQGRVVIRTLGNVFASGSDSVDARYRDLFARAAEALRNESGRVQIIGHTDNVAMRSLRYPSNEELSEARAERVRQMMAQALGSADRLSAEGRGDSEPIAPNTTPQGRQANRRIDIVLAP